MKVTILVNGKLYEIYGVRNVGPMAKHSDGLFFYLLDNVCGYPFQFVYNAKIIESRLCELGVEFNDQDTLKELGWL